MEENEDNAKISRRTMSNGWSMSFEVDVDGGLHKSPTKDDQIDRDDNENTPLIKDVEKSTSEVEHPIYGKTKHHRVKKTWRHNLIGPVVCLYFFGTISSYYVLIEYTNKYWKEEEYLKVNLSLSVHTSACDTNVSQLISDTENSATSKASEWVVYYSIAAGVPSVFANLILGSYTDAFGRKFLLTIGIAGTFLRLGITAVVIFLEADLVYLLIACVVEGLTGQHAACLAVSLSYISDITIPGKARIMGMIIIEVIIGISLSTASFSSGFMVESLGYEWPMFINAGLLALALVITLTLLPETFNEKLRRKDKSAIQVLKVVFQFFTQNDEKNNRWKYQIILLCHALTNMSYLARIPTETLYQLALPFCWSPTKVGVYAAVRTVGMMFIGYGNLAPHTEFGKLSVIAYALVGIPLMFLMLQGLGQHLTILSNKVNKLKLCSKRPAVNRYLNMVLIILLGVSFLFAGPTVLFMYVEGWSLMEGLYYCFVTLSTIGFGDYITALTENRFSGPGSGDAGTIYRIVAYVWIVCGLAYVALIINYISNVLVRKAEKMERMSKAKIEAEIKNLQKELSKSKSQFVNMAESMADSVVNQVNSVKQKDSSRKPSDEEAGNQIFKNQKKLAKSETVPVQLLSYTRRNSLGS